ncbi:hypothetical protein L1987_18475 [Smallanthus sonchifolius]|uniref:Uncharacterized protein n=1 Tax=Smallanthus sonchifolius TaxID=185202 RepID=A0ACB9IZV1_9ASTR|nr:hypothetical protein L1987_18475 [Smallanthus sonchifolius]
MRVIRSIQAPCYRLLSTQLKSPENKKKKPNERVEGTKESDAIEVQFQSRFRGNRKSNSILQWLKDWEAL